MVADTKPAALKTEETIRIIPVAKACAAFPVGFAFLNHGNRQFVAFYDEQRRLIVGTREITSRDFTFFHPKGRWLPSRNRSSSQTDFDSHNYLTMAVDCEEYLHLSGNMHGDPLVYFRSTRPLDITALVAVEAMVGNEEEEVTYPLFFNGRGGRFLFRYRSGGSGNGSDFLNIYNPEMKSWSRLLEQPVLGGEGQRNGYARPPMMGPDGRWHLVWMWRDEWDCETNHDLSYARSPDLVHWEDSDGTTVELPITLSTGEIVDPVPVNGGLINMVHEMGFDNAGRPILTYHKYDSNGFSQAYAARLENRRWVIHQLSQWNFRWDFKGGGSVQREVDLSGAKPVGGGHIEVSFSTKMGGSGVWLINEGTMAVVKSDPARPMLPDSLSVPCHGIHPDAEVHAVVAEGDAAPGGRKHVLRWETLPVNRDRPMGVDVSPTQLEVIEIPAD
jgi:hypothetical protein